MTNREFLLWVRPQLEKAATTGLSRGDVFAIHAVLDTMRRTAPLQPFASKLYNLISAHKQLDVKTVSALAVEIRSELAPVGGMTVSIVLPVPGTENKSRG